MKHFASLASQARLALESKDYKTFALLMDENFDTRRSLYGDAIIGETNLRMIELARVRGFACKFSGSGGAIIGLWKGGSNENEQLQDLRQALEAEGKMIIKFSKNSPNIFSKSIKRKKSIYLCLKIYSIEYLFCFFFYSLSLLFF